MALFWAYFGCNLWFDRARSQAQVNGNKSDSLRKGRLAADRDQQGSAGIRAAEQPSCEKNSPWSQARCGVISWKCAYIYNYIYTYTCNLYTICPYWAMIANPFNAPGLWIQSGLVFITCASFSPEKIWNGFEWFSHLIFESYGVYPLVNVSVAMENPHFWCINELNGHVQRQTVSHYQRVTV